MKIILNIKKDFDYKKPFSYSCRGLFEMDGGGTLDDLFYWIDKELKKMRGSLKK